MDVISRNKRICQLIAKQLWEGLGDDEKQELQEWIQAFPENKLLYDELKTGTGEAICEETGIY